MIRSNKDSDYPYQILFIGDQVEWMTRQCEVVGFEEGWVVLHSLFRDQNGQPTSKWCEPLQSLKVEVKLDYMLANPDHPFGKVKK